jgi:hypothetical protein
MAKDPLNSPWRWFDREGAAWFDWFGFGSHSPLSLLQQLLQLALSKSVDLQIGGFAG